MNKEMIWWTMEVVSAEPYVNHLHLAQTNNHAIIRLCIMLYNLLLPNDITAAHVQMSTTNEAPTVLNHWSKIGGNNTTNMSNFYLTDHAVISVILLQIGK